MEKCFNCGAAVRPGAKYCTSCGTRLTDTLAPAPGTPTRESSSSNGETQVAVPAAMSGTPQDAPAEREGDADDSSPFASWKHASSGWNTPTDTSPADRFEAGLGGETSRDDSPSGMPPGWGAPPPSQKDDEEDRFASWAAAYRPADAGESANTTPSTPERDDSERESGAAESIVISPERASWDTNAPTPVADAAESGDGDATSATSDTRTASQTPSMDVTDARARASSLIDELRSLVWSIGLTGDEGGKDVNLAVIVLAGARGKSGNFSDVRSAIDAVKERPRDLDALESLAAKADRIGELLDNHAQLLAAIDEAIEEMR